MGVRKKEALEQFNRDNILTAARKLFESKGVEKTTMDDIAELADYSKSTIYVYFKSKEDIYNSILQEYLGKLARQMKRCLEADMEFEESYYCFCDCLVEFEEKYPEYYSSLMAGGRKAGGRKADGGKQTNLMDRELGSEINQVITEMLERGQDKKAIRNDIEIKPTVLYVWSAISGIIQVAGRKKDVLGKRLNMNKEEYLRYSFRTFYESLVRRQG